MARVKRGTKRRARRKKYLKRTKGFFLTKSKLYQSAQEAANRADRYAKRDRRVTLDRKVLADIAVKDAAAFTSLVATAKAAAPPPAKAKRA
jgi:large subunit ribosomal protein L20